MSIGLAAKQGQWDWQYKHTWNTCGCCCGTELPGHQAEGRLLGRQRSGLGMEAAEVRVDENFPHGARLERAVAEVVAVVVAGGPWREAAWAPTRARTQATLNSHFTVNTLRRDQIADIWQTTFSNVFLTMKLFEFRLKFHWSLFLGDQLTISQHWFR